MIVVKCYLPNVPDSVAQQPDCICNCCRQPEFRSALFERAVLSPPKVSPAVRQTHPVEASHKRLLSLPFHLDPWTHRSIIRKICPNSRFYVQVDWIWLT